MYRPPARPIWARMAICVYVVFWSWLNAALQPLLRRAGHRRFRFLSSFHALQRAVCFRSESFYCRSNEVPEEWMGPIRPRLELGVELGTEEPGVIGKFDDLHQTAIR